MDKKLKLKIEVVINKLLFQKNIINKDMYEKSSAKLDELMYKENNHK